MPVKLENRKKFIETSKARAKERWNNPEWRKKELKRRKNAKEDYKQRGKNLSITLRKKNKGKSCIACGGYRLLLGFGNGGILEHRYIMEQHLKRKLKSNEVVHHINGDKLDNRLENLIVLKRGEHIKNEHPPTKERNAKISNFANIRARNGKGQFKTIKN